MNETYIPPAFASAPLPIGIMRRLADLWCTLMHDSLMWPIHGQYECRTCGRRQPVAWAQLGRAPHTTKVVSIRLSEVVS